MCLLGFFFVNSLFPTLSFEMMTRLFSRWSDPAMRELFEQLALLMGSVCALLIPFASYPAFVGIPRSSCVPMRKAGVGMATAAVLCALAVSVVASYATTCLRRSFRRWASISFRRVSRAGGFASAAVYWVNMTAVPAVFEEIAFRGRVDAIAAPVRRRLRAARVFGALCARARRSDQDAQRLSHGAVIGYFVLFTGSLRVGMAIHFVTTR
jgi:hypothetical protein